MALEKSNIRSQGLIKNLKSPIVQCAAFCMTGFNRHNFSDFYSALGFYVSEASGDFTKLVEQGIFVKDETDLYTSYYQTFFVSTEYVLEIIAGIRDTELGRYLKAYNKRGYVSNAVNAQKSFSIALHTFLTTQEVEWDSVECTSFFKSLITRSDSVPYSIINKMLASNKYVPFFKGLGSDYYPYLAEIAVCSYERMLSIDEDLHNHYIFFDKEADIYFLDAIIYVLQNELMAHGHLDDLIKKYSAFPRVADYLAAIKGIYDDDFLPIYELSLKYIAEECWRALEQPHMVMFLFAALLKDTSPAATKIATTLSKKRIVKQSSHLLNALLAWKLTRKIPQKMIDELSRSYYNPATHIVFTLFATHCHFFPQSSAEPYYMSYYRNSIMTTSKMNFMRLLYAEEDSAFDPIIDKLRATVGMKSFLFSGERKEKWQIMLENIRQQIEATDAKSGTKASSSSRVAFLIQPASLSVRPILQKSSDGTTWSKGRNVALKSFREGVVDGITDRDLKVAAAVREEQTWSGVSYYIAPRQAIVALIGHPYVFTDDENRLKIDIYSQPLELSVVKGKNGEFSFKFNVDLENIENNIYIDNSNPCSIRVVELTTKQLTLMSQIQSLGNLPPKAAGELSDTLTALGSQMTVMSDLVKKSKDVRITDGSAVMTVQLIPENDIIHAQVFAKPLVEYPPYLTPGKGSEFVSARVGSETVQTKRDLAAEDANFDAVEKLIQARSGNQIDETSWQLSIAEALDVLADINEIPGTASVEWPEGVKMKVGRPTLMPGDFHVKIKNVENWFEIEGKVDIGEGVSMKVSEILSQLRQSRHSRFIRLNDTEYIRLSDHLASLLRQISQTAQQGKGKNVKVSQYGALSLDELERAGVDVKGDRAYRRIIKLINEADTTTIRMPRNLEAELRDYQKEGFKWMARLRMWGAGACLADDMGLGKTLQAIALMLSARKEGPSLVVAPSSVLTNWYDEIRRFAPTLRPVVLNTAYDASRSEMISSVAKGDVLITSYGLLVTKEDELCAVEWNIAVLDEAHTIKNRNTKMSKSAMKINAAMRVALTGTPLQNRLSEIWNIFQFTNPGLLGSFESFTDRFINPIERDGNKERQRALKRLISPFLLRRTKNDVLSELPEKSEITLRIDLSEEEKALYERMRREAEMSVEEGDGSAMQMLAQLTRLRQAAINMRLIYPDLKIESSKTNAFISLVEELIANNHRALVFSQFTSHLDLIKERLDKEGIAYLYLDGATPTAQRAQLVSEFQNGDIPLFLISLKAGGLGLNLTGADYVIHLDPWWNPAIEDQASDRSYRMGQEKPVTVYRIIAANTIEEKILRLHKFKKSLADALLEGSDMSARLTKDDILNLLKEK